MPDLNRSEQSPKSSPILGSNERQALQKFEALFAKIGQAARAQNRQSQLLTVKLGQQTLYQGILDREPNLERASVETLANAIQAIEEPQSLKGTVTIKVGREVIFKNSNGIVERDKYQLATAQRINQDQVQKQAPPTPADYRKAFNVEPESIAESNRPAAQSQTSSEDPRESGIAPLPKEIRQSVGTATPDLNSQKEVEATAPETASERGRIAKLEEQITRLEASNQKLEAQFQALERQLQQITSNPTVVPNNNTEKWLEKVRPLVANKLLAMGQQISNQIERNWQKLQSLLQEPRQRVESAIDRGKDAMHAAKNVLKNQVGQAAISTMTAASRVANFVGEKLPDGTTVVDRPRSNQRLEINDSSLSLKEKPVLDAQKLWNQYAEQVKATERPIQTAVEVARIAKLQGVPKSDIVQIVATCPAFSHLEAKSAQEQSEKIVRKVERSEQQQAQSSTQQQVAQVRSHTEHNTLNQ